MSTTYKKEKMDVIQSYSLRELVETVNNINATTASKILKEDIVALKHVEGSWVLLYYK